LTAAARGAAHNWVWAEKRLADRTKKPVGRWTDVNRAFPSIFPSTRELKRERGVAPLVFCGALGHREAM
jgi:hypothetical protein